MTARFLTWLAAGVFAASAATADPAQDAASATVQQTLDGIVEVLRDRDLADEVRRERVEEIAYTRFDFQTIARLVLARNWKKLSPEQREEFVVEFKQHLSGSYWRTLDDYRDETVELTGSRLARNGDVTVRSRIVGADTQAPILIDYRMRPKGEEWVVIDVIIESVSLVQNFRSQTQEIISDVGVDQLIDQLRKKNAEQG
jgi:phospholipid transport system substrate-binding protein